MTSIEQNPDLEALLEYIRRNRGFDFSGYKRTTLSRRIRKRMQSVGIENYNDYLDYLQVHPDEFIDLFNTILINVTTFFRDPQAWNYIASEIIPIINAKHTSKPIRVWSAGCATGEETYTVAMLLAEALGMEQYCARVKVFATDVDAEALNHSRHATYNANDVKDIPNHLLEKYFERFNNGHYAVQKELRRCVIFGRHDLVQDAPISKIDLLICRNTLMYFNTETQTRILDRFHFALNNGGFLFLGKAEMLLTRNHSFTPVDLRSRVFAKSPNGNLREMLLSIAHPQDQQAVPETVDKIRVYEAAFEVDPVASVILDSNNSLLLANSQARTLFNLNPRDLGRPLQDLELSYRPMELRSCIEQVRSNGHSMTFKDIEYPNSEREMRYLDIQIIPLLNDNTQDLIAIKIIFTEVTRFKQLQNELVHANQELETAYEELQSTNEELETTNEELQSTVEELETTNEELQSTNEELETMNEELQSTNEELQAVNEEVRERSDELNRVNVFLESILTSLRAGVVVLSPDFDILIWNGKAEDLWGLRQDEVLLRNFMSLDIGLPLEPLRVPLREILTGQSNYYEILLDALNRRGRTIQCHVTCTPLLHTATDVQGVILLMEAKKSD